MVTHDAQVVELANLMRRVLGVCGPWCSNRSGGACNGEQDRCEELAREHLRSTIELLRKADGEEAVSGREELSGLYLQEYPTFLYSE